MDNWSRIEAKVLYILQLWYDAFMMEENQYSHIINTYKLLRKEGVLFPPRQQNEKNMLAIKTSSPIFDNLAEISRKFCTKLRIRSKAFRKEKTGTRTHLELESRRRDVTAFKSPIPSFQIFQRTVFVEFEP